MLSVFTVLDGVHTAVGDLYGFIQSDKRCLQTKIEQFFPLKLQLFIDYILSASLIHTGSVYECILCGNVVVICHTAGIHKL